jgi:hypothetical protein
MVGLSRRSIDRTDPIRNKTAAHTNATVAIVPNTADASASAKYA